MLLPDKERHTERERERERKREREREQYALDKKKQEMKALPEKNE
jgi:hypothetical protein